MTDQLQAVQGHQAQGTMERVDKPWGYELIFAHTDRYVGKILHIRAGHRLSRQYHRTKHETLMVESGELALEIGSDGERMRIHLRRRDVFHIAASTIHRLVGVTDVDVIEVSTTELEDVVRLADDYGRAIDLPRPVSLADARQQRSSRRLAPRARATG